MLSMLSFGFHMISLVSSLKTYFKHVLAGHPKLVVLCRYLRSYQQQQKRRTPLAAGSILLAIYGLH